MMDTDFKVGKIQPTIRLIKQKGEKEKRENYMLPASFNASLVELLEEKQFSAILSSSLIEPFSKECKLSDEAGS